ncbi:MAG: AbrB/MazE/SpoVT family DNA-binding domain-containing protein [bacterium]
MKTKIIQIGNSQGIRIPKALLEQSGINGEVQLEVLRQQIIIRPARRARQGWAEAFRLMAARGDDKLLDGEAVLNQSSWDKTEWTW